MNTQIIHDAKQLKDFLGTRYAIAKLGATRCQTEQILIQLSLSSSTPKEACERLQTQIAYLRTVLGAK